MQQKKICLPDGSFINERRGVINNTNYSWVVALVIFLVTQTLGGIWWAATMTTSLEFIKGDLKEVKQTVVKMADDRLSELKTERRLL